MWVEVGGWPPRSSLLLPDRIRSHGRFSDLTLQLTYSSVSWRKCMKPMYRAFYFRCLIFHNKCFGWIVFMVCSSSLMLPIIFFHLLEDIKLILLLVLSAPGILLLGIGDSSSLYNRPLALLGLYSVVLVLLKCTWNWGWSIWSDTWIMCDQHLARPS